MIHPIAAIFFIAFFLNLLYELLHSLLYTTCLEAPLKYYVYLMLKAATFDAASITVAYVLSIILFGNDNPFTHAPQLAALLIGLLIFAYSWEVYSLYKKKWQYTPVMPKILGVGITPLVQLTICGFLSLYIVFYLF
jgi:hypothetical protein